MRRAPRLLASAPPLAHSCLHVRRIPRADLLHTLSSTALGPAGRNVMLQPHQVRARAAVRPRACSARVAAGMCGLRCWSLRVTAARCAQASRRATTTSVSLRIFEPLVPQHPMATLLQRSARPTGLRSRTHAGRPSRFFFALAHCARTHTCTSLNLARTLARSPAPACCYPRCGRCWTEDIFWCF